MSESQPQSAVLTIHRSISFWSGPLVMAFLFWAWRDSLQNSSSVRVGSIWMNNSLGGLRLELEKDRLGGSMGPEFSRYPVAKMSVRAEQFPSPRFLRSQETTTSEEEDAFAPRGDEGTMDEYLRGRVDGDSTAWLLFVPHWLILIAALLLWSLLLLRRARRRKKAIPSDC